MSQDTVTGKISDFYCGHYHSHKRELSHFPVPVEVKNCIASKLQAGVPIERILDDVRDTIHDHIEREHLLSRRDVFNIQRHLNIQCIEKHHSDHVSVSAWVTEMREMTCNSILVFKNQGDDDQGNDTNNLAKDDFLLAFQTAYQRDMMTKFGEKCMCMVALTGLTFTISI